MVLEVAIWRTWRSYLLRAELKVSNIDSRLSYIRKHFNALHDIKQKGSCFGWDDNQKTVTGDRKLFDEWAKVFTNVCFFIGDIMQQFQHNICFFPISNYQNDVLYDPNDNISSQTTNESSRL